MLGAAPTNTPVDTSDTASTTDTAASSLRPIEWRGAGEIGTAMTWVPVDPPLLAIATPAGGIDNSMFDRVDLLEPFVQRPTAGSLGDISFKHGALYDALTQVARR